LILHDKNDFADPCKNLVRYRSENNFVELSKLSCSTLKYNEQCCKKFWHFSDQFMFRAFYLCRTTKIIFKPVSS